MRRQFGRAESEIGTARGPPTHPFSPTCPYKPEVVQRGRHFVLTLSIKIKRLDGRRMILSPDGHDLVLPAEPVPKEHIVNAIGLAYRWLETLLSERNSVTELASEVGVNHNRIRRFLPLTHLSPDVLKRALSGRLPPSLTLSDLLAAAEHLDWEKQWRALDLGERPARRHARA